MGDLDNAMTTVQLILGFSVILEYGVGHQVALVLHMVTRYRLPDNADQLG